MSEMQELTQQLHDPEWSDQDTARAEAQFQEFQDIDPEQLSKTEIFRLLTITVLELANVRFELRALALEEPRVPATPPKLPRAPRRKNSESTFE